MIAKKPLSPVKLLLIFLKVFYFFYEDTKFELN